MADRWYLTCWASQPPETARFAMPPRRGPGFLMYGAGYDDGRMVWKVRRIWSKTGSSLAPHPLFNPLM